MAAVCPQEEVAAATMAFIELTALIGPLLPDSEQDGLLATVAGHRVAFTSSSRQW